MTQPPRHGLNKEARLAAERREEEAKNVTPPLDPPFPHVCLPNPFSGIEGIQASIDSDD